MPSPPPEADAGALASDVEADALRSIVRDVFGPYATVADVTMSRVPKRIINGTTRGIWFVDVDVTAAGAKPRLALVVKSIAAPPAEESEGIDPRFRASTIPRHYNYWQREALVYGDPPRMKPQLRLPLLRDDDRRKAAHVISRARSRARPRSSGGRVRSGRSRHRRHAGGVRAIVDAAAVRRRLGRDPCD